MRGNLCCDKGGVVFRTKVKHFMSSTMEGDGFAFRDGKLFRIMIYIPNQDEGIAGNDVHKECRKRWDNSSHR
jgi:hypothetical protein